MVTMFSHSYMISSNYSELIVMIILCFHKLYHFLYYNYFYYSYLIDNLRIIFNYSSIKNVYSITWFRIFQAVIRFQINEGSHICKLLCLQIPTLCINISYTYLPTARVGYDTWSFFKRSLSSLNSEFSFLLTSCLTNLLFTHSWVENNWIIR